MTTIKVIPEYPIYSATSDGDIVYSINGEYIKKHSRTDGFGYYNARIFHNGKKIDQCVHYLVAQAFHGFRPDGYQINHINGNKKDNRPENLEYCTRSENMKHAQGRKKMLDKRLMVKAVEALNLFHR